MSYRKQIIVKRSDTTSLGGLGWPSGKVYLSCRVESGPKDAMGRDVQLVLEADEFDDFVRAVHQMRDDRKKFSA
jgi:hypothetical protein